MKVIFKILVILVVAALVSGLFYAAVTGTSSGNSQLSTSERPTNGEFTPRDREGSNGGVQFPMDSVKNLLIISTISLVYVQGTKLIKGKKSVESSML